MKNYTVLFIFAVLSTCTLTKLAHLRTLQTNICKETDQNGKCVSCYFRYVVKDGSCFPVSDLCMSWNQESGDCTGCYQGYLLSEGRCSVSPQIETPSNTYDYCISYDQNHQCLACSERAILSNGKCTPVSSVCASWDESTGACTLCYPGWYLSEGVCSYKNSQLYPSTEDDHCIRKDSDGKCLECAYRSVKKDGGCLAVSDECMSWNNESGDCLSCYNGYTLSQGACLI